MYVPSRITKYKWFSELKEELSELPCPTEPLSRLDLIRSTETAFNKTIIRRP